jgi:hypothetical protein
MRARACTYLCGYVPVRAHISRDLCTQPNFSLSPFKKNFFKRILVRFFFIFTKKIFLIKVRVIKRKKFVFNFFVKITNRSWTNISDRTEIKFGVRSQVNRVKGNRTEKSRIYRKLMEWNLYIDRKTQKPRKSYRKNENKNYPITELII